MVRAISVLIAVILLGVIGLCYMVSTAMDYDPSWDDPKEMHIERKEHYPDEED